MPLARTISPFMRCLLCHSYKRKFIAINSIVIGSLVLPNLATAGVCYSSDSYSASGGGAPFVALSEPIPAGAAYTVAWSRASVSSVKVRFDHSADSSYGGQTDMLESFTDINGFLPYTGTVSSANNGGVTNYFRFDPLPSPVVFYSVVISSATCGTGSSSGTPATAVPTLPLFGLLTLGGLLGFFGLRKLKK